MGEADRECLVPGKSSEAISTKGTMVERQEFEKMKSEYHEYRGWGVDTGLQTTTTLKESELSDVIEDLEKRGLVK